MAWLWARVDRRALLVTAICLVVWRLLDQIPLVDVTRLFIVRRVELYSQPGFFAAIGPNSIRFNSYSVGAEGIGPYINAVITMNLVAIISTRVRGMVRDDDGRIRLQKWTRTLALALAFGQAYGFTVLGQDVGALPGVMDWSSRLLACLTLSGGTAVMILLAGALDEYGLGFGYGAWILYSLGYVVAELHRLADYLATSPSTEALYWPLAVWSILTIGATVAAVPVLLAVRRLNVKGKRVEIRLLASGVARPQQLAFALLFVPTIVANYTSQVGGYAVRWFAASWALRGPSPWLDVAYGAIEATLIVVFAVFIAQVDFWTIPGPAEIRRHVPRLALIGGVFLALVTVGLPVVADWLVRRPGTAIPPSGYSVVLVVAVVLVVVRSIEGRRPVPPLTASPLGIP